MARKSSKSSKSQKQPSKLQRVLPFVAVAVMVASAVGLAVHIYDMKAMYARFAQLADDCKANAIQAEEECERRVREACKSDEEVELPFIVK